MAQRQNSNARLGNTDFERTRDANDVDKRNTGLDGPKGNNGLNSQRKRDSDECPYHDAVDVAAGARKGADVPGEKFTYFCLKEDCGQVTRLACQNCLQNQHYMHDCIRIVSLESNIKNARSAYEQKHNTMNTRDNQVLDDMKKQYKEIVTAVREQVEKCIEELRKSIQTLKEVLNKHITDQETNFNNEITNLKKKIPSADLSAFNIALDKSIARISERRVQDEIAHLYHRPPYLATRSSIETHIPDGLTEQMRQFSERLEVLVRRVTDQVDAEGKESMKRQLFTGDRKAPAAPAAGNAPNGAKLPNQREQLDSLKKSMKMVLYLSNLKNKAIFHLKAKLKGHRDQVNAICKLNEKIFASGGYDQNLLLWDVKTQKVVHRYAQPLRACIDAITKFGNDKVLFAGGGFIAKARIEQYLGQTDLIIDEKMLLLPDAGQKSINNIIQLDDEVFVAGVVVLTHHSQLVVAKISEMEIEAVKDFAHNAPLHLNALAYIDTGVFASCARDKKLIVWNRKLEQLYAFPGTGGMEFACCLYLPALQMLIASHKEGLSAWKYAPQQQQQQPQQDKVKPVFSLKRAHSGWITALKAAGKQSFMSSSLDRSTKVWTYDPEEKEPLYMNRELKHEHYIFTACHFRARDILIATENAIELWK